MKAGLLVTGNSAHCAMDGRLGEHWLAGVRHSRASRARPCPLSWLVVAAMITLSPCTASAQTGAVNGPFASRTWNLEVSGQLLGEAWNLNGVRETLAGGRASVGYAFTDRWQLHSEFALLRVTQKTGYEVLVPAVSPMLRWLGYRGRAAAVFLEFGPGVSYATEPVPPRGTRFNYVVQAGGGVAYRLSTHLGLVSGLRWLHVSNNDLAGPFRNPDIQALGGYVGVTIG